MDFNSQEILDFIQRSLVEDVGPGDYSGLSAISEKEQGMSTLFCKDNGIIAGMELAAKILHVVNPTIVFNPNCKDGDVVSKGFVLATASGDVRSLLIAERLLLNCMQRLSGIASMTKLAVEKIKNYHTKILDTRKTTPGLRMLEKWAVKTGGGTNHRFGLYDMVMLKDNHIDSAGGITNAVNKSKAFLSKNNLELKIEVETRNLAEVEEALACAIDRIMLDNFTPELCTQAVALIAGNCETEASGGIHFENLEEYAKTGVDFISLGYLTHTVKSLDISMKTKKYDYEK